jgi:TRAP-type C4-dicarboxylate transport system permease small subunit
LVTSAGEDSVTLRAVRRGFERLLEVVVIVLLLGLSAVVIAGAAFRYSGHALAWYDEVASTGLVWLTYYGAALAALRGAHIGVPGLVNAMPPTARVIATVFAEIMVFAFLIVLAVTGWQVEVALRGEYMVSLPTVSLQLTQSAIPVGAILFIIAEALRLPDVLRDARGQGFVDVEIKEALELGHQPDSGADGPKAGDRS